MQAPNKAADINRKNFHSFWRCELIFSFHSFRRKGQLWKERRQILPFLTNLGPEMFRRNNLDPSSTKCLLSPFSAHENLANEMATETPLYPRTFIFLSLPNLPNSDTSKSKLSSWSFMSLWYLLGLKQDTKFNTKNLFVNLCNSISLLSNLSQIFRFPKVLWKDQGRGSYSLCQDNSLQF